MRVHDAASNICQALVDGGQPPDISDASAPRSPATASHHRHDRGPGPHHGSGGAWQTLLATS
jgi:hypothetical protein